MSTAAGSRLDLPLEQHTSALQKLRSLQLDHEERESRFPQTPSLFSRRTTSFERVENELPVGIHRQKQIFGFLIVPALKKVAYETKAQLDIIENQIRCKDELEENIGIPNRLFSWSFEDFLKRLDIKDNIWLLDANLPAKCLSLKKNKFDIQEIWRYMSLIFRALTEELFTDPNAVVKEINNAYEFLHLNEYLQSELLKNNKTFADDVNVLFQCKFFTDNDQQTAKEEMLQNKLLNSTIVDSIEMRYQLRVNRNQAKQHDYKITTTLRKIENEIDLYVIKTANELKVSQYSLDVMKEESMVYRKRIEKMNQKYDRELESIQSAIVYKMSSMEKMRALRGFYEEQIRYFHDEIENIQLKQLAKQKAEEEKAALAAEMALLYPKKKKAKKSNGRKNKKKL